jgi:hypothetical protein
VFGEEDSPPQKKLDRMLGVRVVLLIATGISAFAAPWLITAALALAWILVMVWPKQSEDEG